MASLTPIVSANPPLNPSIGWNNSWITINNDQNRALYAQATYLTNPGDIQLILSAGNVDIGHVKIEGGNTTNVADVVNSNGGYALRVATQPSISASITNSVTAVTLLNPVTALSATITNPITAVTVSTNGNTLAVSGSVTVSNTVSATLPGTVNVSYADSSNIDAFGRLRTSTPHTLFDSKTLHSKSSLFWSQTSIGTGVVQFTGDTDASVTLSAAANGDYAIRQTTQRFNYQPGKSQLGLFTGVLSPVNNAIKRIGLFTSLTAAPYTPNLGLYFETQTDHISSIAVVQNNGSNLVPSVSARRENWNIDKLDGTGPSGKTITLSAANIFIIDYEWLGVGRVRFGTVIDGQICYCHAINNAGNVQGAYLKSPNLPVRAEIRQTGAGTATMKMICCSVMSEGGADFTGVTRATDTGSTPLTIAVNARRAVLGVRLQSNKLDSVNEVLNTSAIAIAAAASTHATYKYEILHNPYGTSYFGVSGGTWTDIDENSNYQYWRSNSTNPGGNQPFNGTVITSGYGAVGSTIDLSGYRFEKFLRLGCSVAGQRDELYLVITPLEANNGVFGSLTFIESD